LLAQRLHGRSRVLGRTLWMLTLLLTLVWFGMALLSQVAAFEHPCTGASCLLTPAQATTLRHAGISRGVLAAYFVGAPALLVLAGTLIAALLFSRRSDSWLTLLVGLFLVGMPVMLFGQIGGVLANPVLALALQTPAVIVTYAVSLVFPDGRFVPRWTSLLLVAWAAYVVLATVVLASGAQHVSWGALSVPLYLLCLGGLSAQIFRYRRVSTTIQQQQTRWVVLGFAVILGAAILFWGALPQFIPAFRRPDAIYFLTGYPLYEIASFALPLSFVIAMQRHHLFEVDVLINRSLVYGSLTALLAALYVVLVIGLQRLAHLISSQAATSPVIIVASTLLIAALANPLRQRIQSAVDRRFYRRKYDATRILTAFGSALRMETDLARLSARLIATVEEATQPSHVSLWLITGRPTENERPERADPAGLYPPYNQR
jgi:hypothetical protein